MTSTSGNKRILLLSDDGRVAKIIEAIQAHDLAIVRFMLQPPEQTEVSVPAGRFDLILLSLSVYENEPIVALARTSLAGLIGHLPILIISEKPFQSDAATLITYMNLPFSVTQLRDRVRDILGLPQALPCANR